MIHPVPTPLVDSKNFDILGDPPVRRAHRSLAHQDDSPTCSVDDIGSRCYIRKSTFNAKDILLRRNPLSCLPCAAHSGFKCYASIQLASNTYGSCMYMIQRCCCTVATCMSVRLHFTDHEKAAWWHPQFPAASTSIRFRAEYAH
jgi:hypothetical protein